MNGLYYPPDPCRCTRCRRVRLWRAVLAVLALAACGLQLPEPSSTVPKAQEHHHAP